MSDSKPAVLRHTVPEYVEITYSCLSYGEDMEYHDGLTCIYCGLEWNSPTAEPQLSVWWIEFAQNAAPDATAENPVHLMIYRQRQYLSPVAWFIHVGCVEDTYDHTGKCALTQSVGTREFLEDPGIQSVTPGVPYRIDAMTGELLLPTGVYQVETSKGREKVTAVLAYAGGDDGQNLSQLIDPREAAPRLLDNRALNMGDLDTEAWTAARSPEFLAYWDEVAENRRRTAVYEARRQARRTVENVELPGVD